MEYLAAPAPNVEEETVSVEKAPKVENVFAEPAISEERVVVEEAPVVKPAVAGGENDYKSSSSSEQPRLAKGRSQSHPLSLETLRGATGSDFESIAAVVPRPGSRKWYQKWFPIVFEERHFLSFGEAQKLILVKGGCCFIFTDDLSVSPLYAIPLGNLFPVLEDRKKPHPRSITISPVGINNLSSDSIQTVLLMLGDTIEFQFSFNIKDGQTNAKKFMDVVACETEIVTEEKAILLAEVEIFLSSEKKKG